MAIYVFPQPPEGYCSIHYRPALLTAEQRAQGIPIAAIPARPAVLPNCFLALKGDINTQEVWWENVEYPYDALESNKEAGREEIRAIARTLVDIDTMSDEQLVAAMAIYPAWAANVAYNTGDFLTYDNHLYQVITGHTSQADWAPPLTPALFVRRTPEGTIAAWVQPTGAHDAYPLGAIVTHNGQTWQSTVDANVWEPGVYGWVVV